MVVCILETSHIAIALEKSCRVLTNVFTMFVVFANLFGKSTNCLAFPVPTNSLTPLIMSNIL